VVPVDLVRGGLYVKSIKLGELHVVPLGILGRYVFNGVEFLGGCCLGEGFEQSKQEGDRIVFLKVDIQSARKFCVVFDNDVDVNRKRG
jgi:hypothetical protein